MAIANETQTATPSTGSTASMSISPTAVFSQRHIGPSDSHVAAMLRTIGMSSLPELIAETVPASILEPGDLRFGPALSEPHTIHYPRTVSPTHHALPSPT